MAQRSGTKKKPRQRASPTKQSADNNKSSRSSKPSATVLSLLSIPVAILVVSLKIKEYLPSPSKPNAPEHHNNDISDFLAWFKDRGGSISSSDGAGNGGDIVVSGGRQNVISKSDELFTVPRSIIVSARSVIDRFASLSRQNNSIASGDMERIVSLSFQSPLVQQDVYLSLHLMAECSLGTASKLLPYLRMLPTDVPRLDTFDEEALEVLRDDYLATLARQSREELSTAWHKNGVKDIALQMARMVAIDSGLSLEDEAVSRDDCLTFESFHRFVAIASSRAMILEGGTKYLAPLADMMNYMPRYDNNRAAGGTNESFLTYHSRNSDGSITVRADRNVVAGNQIFEDYGETDNSLFLEAFGFVPNANPSHCAVIPPEIIPQPSSLPVELLDVLIEQGIVISSSPDHPPSASDAGTLCISAEGVVTDERMRTYLATTQLDEKEGQKQKCINACRRRKETELITRQCTAYPGHREAVETLIRNLARQTYCEASTTIGEDTALLQQRQLDDSRQDSSMALAVKFLVEEKRTLLSAAEATGKPVVCSSEHDNRATNPEL
eukprot:CAMPEP_0178473268 /NCGR_PEP_ID=MMETSP0696-20121128/1998_1 /TAXON_ID=265572 /ORGANISM="Extubocellulus spinifer, Strain CCMP396" /LENGTH=553 /DNA_ID=CAMNT_0020100483 /DNA_START=34 /DNA_END=1695 /DNA_ORIENTATION=+